MKYPYLNLKIRYGRRGRLTIWMYTITTCCTGVMSRINIDGCRDGGGGCVVGKDDDVVVMAAGR